MGPSRTLRYLNFGYTGVSALSRALQAIRAICDGDWACRDYEDNAKSRPKIQARKYTYS